MNPVPAGLAMRSFRCCVVEQGLSSNLFRIVRWKLRALPYTEDHSIAVERRISVSWDVEGQR